MQGRKPLPTQMKVLAGNPGRRPLNPAEPSAPAHSGRCPRWVPRGEARAVWARLAPVLLRSQVLTELDEQALGLTCCAIADYLDARAIPPQATIRAIGAALAEDPDQGALVVEALLARAKSSTSQLRAATALLAEFGLTPSSRSRIKVSPAGGDDPLDVFLRGRGAA